MTIQNKLKTLREGKEQIVNAVNEKANTSLPANCSWQELSDTVSNISGGSGENTLKKLLDHTKSAASLMHSATLTDSSEYIQYNDTENVTNMNSMFNACTKLVNVKLNTLNNTGMNKMFDGCNSLVKIDLSHFCTISATSTQYMCRYCYSLKTVIFRDIENDPQLHSGAFTDCYHLTGTVNSKYNPDGLKDGYIYVPRDMVDILKAATNWSVYADQIRALEDYTVGGTTTGDLDESKI